MDLRLSQVEQAKAKPILKEIFKTTIKQGTDVAIAVTFPYDEGLVEVARSVRGRFWNAADKRNEYPYTAEVFEAILGAFADMSFSVDTGLQKEFKAQLEQRTEIVEAADNLNEEIDIPGLGGTLYPFQAACVDFLVKTNGRAMIADEMGTGKTVELLAYCQLIRHNLRKVLAIVPASLKFMWRDEALRWLDSDWSVTVIRTEKDPLPEEGLAIISYSLASKRRKDLVAWAPDLVTTDECHYLKNKKAKRTKAILGYKSK